ncbi:MAG TPA: hypothetical protein DDW52_11190 [Planctomycetaceae bacterium]|nr:hypothetical protein [Planctomycetaceae bacterium]
MIRRCLVLDAIGLKTDDRLPSKIATKSASAFRQVARNASHDRACEGIGALVGLRRGLMPRWCGARTAGTTLESFDVTGPTVGRFCQSSKIHPFDRLSIPLTQELVALA